eukprot:CAMPEP_0179097910 /NCGR_PEP_ID=MMETSP0796-20121207/45089_1 /TAXON_ID=73915 /ORGANISM="Pyrodinium bahamense, Strain pbaha01" /LENGTH=208 /DNA_ID=CAMNT_0020795667 /DNA_START=440 /DNA_END=1062 /DNA_ORIENTATION=+
MHSSSSGEPTQMAAGALATDTSIGALLARIARSGEESPLVRIHDTRRDSKVSVWRVRRERSHTFCGSSSPFTGQEAFADAAAPTTDTATDGTAAGNGNGWIATAPLQSRARAASALRLSTAKVVTGWGTLGAGEGVRPRTVRAKLAVSAVEAGSTGGQVTRATTVGEVVLKAANHLRELYRERPKRDGPIPPADGLNLHHAGKPMQAS